MPRNNSPQLVFNDLRADILVSQIELSQKMVVEEVTERAVSDVMQQRRHPQQTLDVRSRRYGRTRIAQRGIPLVDGHGG